MGLDLSGRGKEAAGLNKVGSLCKKTRVAGLGMGKAWAKAKCLHPKLAIVLDGYEAELWFVVFCQHCF